MSLENWNNIKKRALFLQELSDEGKWDELNDVAEEFWSMLYNFFENDAHNLDNLQAEEVKADGAKLMMLLKKINCQAKDEKKIIFNNSVDIAKAKKGISAYKKIT